MSMRFVVSSGTDIQSFVERYDSAALALDAVLELLATKRPDVRICDEAGENVALDDLRRLAEMENESEDA
jgi:hypothetical protein